MAETGVSCIDASTGLPLSAMRASNVCADFDMKERLAAARKLQEKHRG
jgi:hypothetical protein